MKYLFLSYIYKLEYKLRYTAGSKYKVYQYEILLISQNTEFN